MNVKPESDRALFLDYLNGPDVAALGAEPIANSPAEFAAMIKSETAKWIKIVKDANIKPE